MGAFVGTGDLHIGTVTRAEDSLDTNPVDEGQLRPRDLEVGRDHRVEGVC